MPGVALVTKKDMLFCCAGALPVIGTAQQVAEKLAALHAGGLEGVLMVFQAYYQDTLRFSREVQPARRLLLPVQLAAGSRRRPKL